MNSLFPNNFQSLKALDFFYKSKCDQIILTLTHKSGNCLETIVTDSPAGAASNNGSPTGTSKHDTFDLIFIPGFDRRNIFHQMDCAASTRGTFVEVSERSIPS